MTAVIHASTTARDTDWVVRLARIDVEGNPLVLAQGIVRARFRDSLTDPELLEPGKTYGTWINSQEHTSFRDTYQNPAIPYLLIFKTRN